MQSPRGVEGEVDAPGDNEFQQAAGNDRRHNGYVKALHGDDIWRAARKAPGACRQFRVVGRHEDAYADAAADAEDDQAVDDGPEGARNDASGILGLAGHH